MCQTAAHHRSRSNCYRELTVGFRARRCSDDDEWTRRAVDARNRGDRMTTNLHRAAKIIVLLLVTSTVAACGPVYVTRHDQVQRDTRYQKGVSAPTATNQCANGPRSYTELNKWGVWAEAGAHGCVWLPNAGQNPAWRPYYFGNWEYTRWGWTWESKEPWSWATYHYGRWFWHRDWGWAWKPGYTWGPAWVTWRSGGGSVGWAPMGPAGVRHNHHVYWTFVVNANFRRRNVHTHVVKPTRSPTVYNQTVVIRNTGNASPRPGKTTVYHRGPRPATVTTWTRTKVITRDVNTIPSARPRTIPPRRAKPVPSARPAPGYRAAPRTRPAPTVRPATRQAPVYRPAPATRRAPATRPAPATRRPAPATRPRTLDTGSRPRPGTTRRPGPGITPHYPTGREPPARVVPAARGGTRPVYNPAGRTAPGTRPVYRPGTRPAPAKRPVYRPGTRPAPAKRPVYRPGTRPAPAKRPVYRPSTRPAPATRPAPHPRGRPAPATRPSRRPAPRPATRPTPRPTSRPTRPVRPAAPATRPARRPAPRPTGRPTRPAPRGQPGARPPSADTKVNPTPVKPGTKKKNTHWDTRELKDPRPRGVPDPTPARGTRGGRPR
jgi:hypothetical protein